MFAILKRKPEPKPLWLTQIADELLAHTPDAATIMRYELQLLFVYDQMMGGMYEFDRLGPEAMFGATAYTSADYVLWKKRLGLKSEAIALQPEQGQERPSNPFHSERWSLDTPARIQGEIYAVRPEKLIKLDIYKRNMVEFRRIRVRLVVPYREVSWIKERDAIAYLTNRTEPNSIVLTDEKVAEVKAWMYVGDPSYWDDLLDGGYLFQPVRLFKPKSTVTRLGIPQYARFSQLEYE